MKWKMLLVEDDPFLLESLAELLSEGDVSITKAINGEEGLFLLKNHTFDIVVSDIAMPLMDGITMFENAKAADIQVPLIFFSAQVRPEMVENLKARGVQAVIPKPYFEKLVVEVERILDHNHKVVDFLSSPFIKDLV